MNGQASIDNVVILFKVYLTKVSFLALASSHYVLLFWIDIP